MTEFGPNLVVLATQVTIPVLGGLLLSRRRDPAVACGPVVVAAVAVLLLTPLAFAPRTVVSIPDRIAPAADDRAAADHPTDQTASTSFSNGIDILSLLRLPPPEHAAEVTPAIDYWRVVSLALAGVAVAGVAQLLLGVFITWRTVQTAPRVTDSALLDLAAELRAGLGCRRAFALHESDRVGTAATAGWLRQVILVTPSWRHWSAAERRAVLSHEIAHVARGDFALRLVARLAVALHGYHPLVRWLAGRLELLQEMAADCRAATQCGGRHGYLKCLAALALRADARPVSLVPTFLSRPPTLLRRIAMLRVTEDTPRPRRHWLSLTAVAVLAAGALGLHGSTRDALAGPVIRAKAEAEVKRPPLDASFVLPSTQPDEVGVYAVRVGALFRIPGMEKAGEMYAGLIETLMGDGKKTHFALTDVEQLSGRVTLTHDPKKPAPNRSLTMSLTSVRMEKDFDWVKQLREWGDEWKEHTHAKTKYYSAKMSVPVLGFKDTTVWFYLPDARTVVLESEENIKKLIDARSEAAAPVWAPDWKAVEDGMLAVVIPDVKGKLPPKMPTEKTGDPIQKAAVESLVAIFKKASRAAIGLDLGGGCSFKVRLACGSAADAADVDAGCQAIAKLAKTVFEGDKDEPKDELEKAGKRLTTYLVRGIEFGTTVDHVVEMRTSAAGGLTDFLKAFSAAAGGK